MRPSPADCGGVLGWAVLGGSVGIFVDDMGVLHREQEWFHLMSDRTDDEIHQFAHKLGLSRKYFHFDHYDLTLQKRQQAIRLGAIETTSLELIAIRKVKRMLQK